MTKTESPDFGFAKEASPQASGNRTGTRYRDLLPPEYLWSAKFIVGAM
jgi:hypothetical protein